MSLLLWILMFILLLIAAVACCYWWVSAVANGRLYDTVEALPHRKTALLLGTAKYTTAGQPNLFFDHRIAAATAVIKSNKADQLIISGADKVPHTPDEVDFMYHSLADAGILPEIIRRDHRGTRTWHTVLRCKMIYKTLDPIIISQRFHNQRAVFIALRMGMQPIGINAKKVAGPMGSRMILRESLARVKCLMDCYLLKPRMKA